MCTCVRLSAEDGTVVVGRTQEFAAALESQLAALPRGYAGVSAAPDGDGVTWVANYGVVGVSAFGHVGLLADGINEKGLYAGDLYMPGSCEYTPADGKNASSLLAPADMVAFVLGTCADVAETRTAMASVNVWSATVEAMGFAPPLHLVVHDRSGDSAVFEWRDGEMIVFDNPIGVTTNAPHFDWHTTNLRNYVSLGAVNPTSATIAGVELHPFGQGVGMTGLPGNSSPPARFVRAASFVATHQGAADGAAAELDMFHIMNNFDIPGGSVVSADGTSVEHTRYTVIANLHDSHYIVQWMHDPTPRLIDLNTTDFDTGPRQTPLPNGNWLPMSI